MLIKIKNLVSQSLKIRVMLVVVTVFMTIVILIMTLGRHFLREDILALSSQQQRSATNVAAAQLNHDFNDRLEGLAIAAKVITPSMIDNPALIDLEFKRRPILFMLFNDGLSIVKPDGVTINDQRHNSQPFADQATINAVLSGQVKSMVGPPTLDKNHQTPLVLMVQAVTNAQGQVIAALVGATSLSKTSFIDKVTVNHYGKSGEFIIVDPKHRLIVSASDKTRVMEYQLPSKNLDLMDQYMAGYEGTLVGTNRYGVQVLESSKTIPANGWQLIVTMPISEIFTPIRGLSNVRFVTGSLIVGIVIIFASWLSLRIPFRPITEAAQTLANWSAHPESFHQQNLIVHQHDEVGTLIQAFNKLLNINRARENQLLNHQAEYKKMAIVAQTTTNIVSITDRYGYLLWVNPAFNAHTGYSEAFVLGKKPGSFLQGEGTDQDTVKIIHGAIKHHKGFDVEILNYKKSGEPYWTHIIATPINSDDENTGYVAIQTDITEKKYALAIAEQDHNDKAALFDSNPNPMVVLNAQRHVSYVNPAFCQLFKVNAQQILFLSEFAFDDFIQEKCINADNYLTTSSLPIIADLKSGKTAASTNNNQLGFSIKLGVEKTIARHYIDCNIPRISRIIYYQDITEKILIDKMKSEFVATAAHELRTPMTIIYGYTELLTIGAGNADEQHEMLEVIHNQSHAMIHLLNDMLDVARIEAQAVGLYQTDRQQIGPRLQTLADTFITSDNHNKINFYLSPNLPEVNVDIGKIEQAVKNCLSNAYKFSPQHGEINMRVTEVMRDKQRMVLIAIEDQGIGMTAEQLARVFEKFYRADPSGTIPGTGLGMAIIKSIIEQHGGSVEIESQYGVGTQVLLYLPVADEV